MEDVAYYNYSLGYKLLLIGLEAKQLLLGCLDSHLVHVQEIAECLQQNAKSEKATAFLIWKALLFSV